MTPWALQAFFLPAEHSPSILLLQQPAFSWEGDPGLCLILLIWSLFREGVVWCPVGTVHPFGSCALLLRGKNSTSYLWEL
jgi:hypothetical protein